MIIRWEIVSDVLNSGTVAVAVVLGLIVGHMLYRERRSPWGYVFRTMITGMAFIIAIGAFRVLQHSDRWEAWIGSAVLWWVYTAGVFASSSTKR